MLFRPKSAVKRRYIGLSISLGIVATGSPLVSKAEPWQNLIQPIGVLLVNPPQSALTVNLFLASLDSNITPATYPFELSTDVTSIRTTQKLYFARVYNAASGSNAVGTWIVRASDLRGKTIAQIRDVLALPSEPDKFTMVEVPEGITMFTGLAGPIAGWGSGGATQSKLMGPPYVPGANFKNQQVLTDCFLCYRVLAPSGSGNRVATVLDRNIPVAYSNLDTVYNNLDLLYYEPTAPAFRQALASMSGEGATGAQTVMFANASTFINAISQETRNWVTRPRALNASDTPQGVAVNRIWASLSGGRSRVDGTQGAATLNSSGANLQIGTDRNLNANIMAGFAVGGGQANYSVNDLNTNGNLNLFNLSVYTVTRMDNAYIASTLAYSRAWTKIDRDVAVNTLANRQKGSFTGQTASVRLEAGYVHKTGNLSLTPFVALEPTWLWQPSFSEQMSATNTPVNMGLNYQSVHSRSLPASLGLQVESKIEMENGWQLRPTAQASWIYEFSPDREVTAALQLLPNQPFTVAGAAAPRNRGLISLGLVATSRTGTSAYFTLDTAFSNTTIGFLAQAGVRIPF